MIDIQQMMGSPLIKAAVNSGNPKQFLMNYIKTTPSISNNPMLNSIMDDISCGKQVNIADIGRNIAREAGIENPDAIVNQLLQIIKQDYTV